MTRCISTRTSRNGYLTSRTGTLTSRNGVCVHPAVIRGRLRREANDYRIHKTLKSKHGFVINGGYGKIKGLTFRISNMGNETAATLQELIDAMDDVLG